MCICLYMYAYLYRFIQLSDHSGDLVYHSKLWKFYPKSEIKIAYTEVQFHSVIQVIYKESLV